MYWRDYCNFLVIKKKIMGRLTMELHRAVFRLVIAEYHILQVFDNFGTSKLSKVLVLSLCCKIM